MKRCAEWWAVFGAVWANERRHGEKLTRQQPDKTFVTEEIPRSLLAARCAREADEALAALAEHDQACAVSQKETA